MLFILAGPSGVGKSYCLEYLSRNFNFKTLTPYTTRQPRISESEGFHYHFRSASELKQLSANLSLGHWARPLSDGHIYGYTSDVDALADDPQNWIIQAYTDIAFSIKKKAPGAVLVFLDFADDEAMEERIVQRYYADGSEAVARRRLHAGHERAAKARFEYPITSNSPEQIARELLQVILSRSSALPQRPVLSPPGPLSDADIASSLEAPEGLRIYGVSREQILSRINGWSFDLTLAPRFYRVVYPLIFRRVFDLASGNSVDMLKRFRECQASESEGVYLKPQEFVLATTVERLSIPPRMVCLLSGRSSYARMGVSVELSQIVLQPGHDDTIPLQIKNNMPYPIIIYPGTSVAQAVFFQTISPSAHPYNERARAKYPSTMDDFRSRYYLDPAYEKIRKSHPVKRPVDWDYAVNVLLMVATWSTAASWIVGLVPDPGFASAGRHFAVLFFALTTFTLIIRVLRWFRWKL